VGGFGFRTRSAGGTRA